MSKPYVENLKAPSESPDSQLPSETVIKLIKEISQKHPHLPSLKFKDRFLSYQELERKSDELAQANTLIGDQLPHQESQANPFFR